MAQKLVNAEFPRRVTRTHVIPALGARKLAQLSAEEVDEWLATKSKTLSTDTLHRLLSILRQSIRRAQARDLVKRNVALLCDVPRGTAGRPSKALTLAQPRICSRLPGNTRPCTPTLWFRCSQARERRNCGR
jgi:response regulator of citrate/malate metabolism